MNIHAARFALLVVFVVLQQQHVYTIRDAAQLHWQASGLQLTHGLPVDLRALEGAEIPGLLSKEGQVQDIIWGEALWACRIPAQAAAAAGVRHTDI